MKCALKKLELSVSCRTTMTRNNKIKIKIKYRIFHFEILGDETKVVKALASEDANAISKSILA